MTPVRESPHVEPSLSEQPFGMPEISDPSLAERDRLRQLATLPPEQWPLLMTIAETAAVCRVSERLLFAWRHTKQGPRPALQGKRRWIYPRHKVVAYLETIGALPASEARLRLVKRSVR